MIGTVPSHWRWDDLPILTGHACARVPNAFPLELGD